MVALLTPSVISYITSDFWHIFLEMEECMVYDWFPVLSDDTVTNKKPEKFNLRCLLNIIGSNLLENQPISTDLIPKFIFTQCSYE